MTGINENFKPMVFWSFNDKLEYERLEKQMDSLLEQGWNCGFLHSRVGLVTPYMSDKWLSVIRDCCEGLRKRNSHAWLYDEDRWPSGYGGGSVTNKRPDLASMCLCLLPEGKEAELNVIRRFKSFTHDDKKWELAVVQTKNGENPWFSGGAYPDFLNPESTKEFLKCIHDKYADNVGEFFGHEIRGIFFDEPCYIQRKPYPCVPFSIGVEKSFEETYGYSLKDNIELLFFDLGNYRKVRRDYYQLITELFVFSFTEEYQRWCTNHGVMLTGHFLNEDTLTGQIECIGAAMPHYQKMDIPGIDILGLGNEKLFTVIQLTSVAEQLGKLSICESVGCIGHQSGPQQMKSITDWLNVLGVSLIDVHLTLYSMRGERKRDYPSNISWLQPWFRMCREYTDHVARVSEFVSEGISQVDTLIIHPMSSVWSEYSPLHRKYPNYSIWSETNPHWRENFSTEVEAYQKPFFELSDLLYRRGIAHHYGDEIVIRDHARIENGALIIGRQKYTKIIVPPMCTMLDSTSHILMEFAVSAGNDRIIFIESRPEGISPIGIVRGINDAYESLADEVCSECCIYEQTTSRIAEKVFVNARTIQGKNAFFITNTGDSIVYATVKLRSHKKPIVVDTMTGYKYSVCGTDNNEGYSFDVIIKMGGSILLCYDDHECPVAEVLKSGADFRKEYSIVKSIIPYGKVLSDNMLPLDRVDFICNQFSVVDEPIESLWNRYYSLPEGTEYSITYHFALGDANLKLYAMIEMARNLKSIKLNGIELSRIVVGPEEGIFDFNFDKVMLEGCRKGTNDLTICGIKVNNVIGMANHCRVDDEQNHSPNELENIFICGEFEVVQDAFQSMIIPKTESRVSGNIVNCGYPFYSGLIEYNVEIPEEARWMRITANGNACRISADNSEDSQLIAPFDFDLSEYRKMGMHDITVQLAGSLVNSFGPLHVRKRDELKMIGPALMYDMKRYSKEPVLFPFGIEKITFFK